MSKAKKTKKIKAVKKEPEQCINCQLEFLAGYISDISQEFFDLLNLSKKEAKQVPDLSDWAYVTLDDVRDMRAA